MTDGFPALIPLLAISVGALTVVVLEAFLKRRRISHLGYVSLASLAASGVSLSLAWGRGLTYFGGALVLDGMGILLGLMIVVAGALFVLMSMAYLERQAMSDGEYYALLLLGLAGLMIMVTSTNLLVVFLGLEVLSVSSYALAGLKRRNAASTEAAVKYFLVGSFATAFLVFGLALVFGAAGTLELPGLAPALIPSATGPASRLAGWAGLTLIVAGFGFKVAVVPFHMWAPDVYQGAPTPVTAFFSVGPKVAAFAVLFRLLAPLWGPESAGAALSRLVWAVAAVTILVGNLAALRQKNLKRLLAYSSIAHSGYILLAVLAGDGASLMFYLLVYLFMNAGAFSALIAMGGRGIEYVEIGDFAGIGFKHPWVGASFAVFLFSLAGFPPTAGFLAKFYVFGAAVREGHVLLAVIAVAGSLVSVYYYLRVVVVMYMKDPVDGVRVEARNRGLDLVLFVCLWGVLQLGLWPGGILALVRQAAESLF